MDKIGLAAIMEMSNFNKGMGQYMSGVGQMESKTDSAASRIGNLAAGMGKAIVGGAVAATAAVTGLSGAMLKLAIDAAPLEGIGQAFEVMAGRAGLALEDLRAASKGMISDFELMRTANVALTGAGEQLGQEFGKNLPRLLEIAQAAAKATGQDAGFLFNSLVTGIKRTSPMLIDNTGLQLKLGEANEVLAKQLGKTVEELTAEEKQIAILNATLAAGETMVSEFGGGQLTASERMAQFRAQIQNVRDGIGKALLPALSELLKPLNELAIKVGPQIIDWAEEFGAWLAEHIPKALNRLAWIWATVWPAISGAVKTAASVIRGFAEVVTDKLGGVIEGAAEAWDRFREALAGAMDYLGDSGILGSILGIVEALLPFRSMLGIIRGAIDLLRQAWDENWGGIRDKLLDVWGKIKPALEKIGEWLGKVRDVLFRDDGRPGLPGALDLLRDALENLGVPQDLIDRISTLAETLQEFANTAYQGALEWWEEHGPTVIERITEFAENVAEAAVKFAEFAANLLITSWQTTLDWFLTDGPGVWENIERIAGAVDKLLKAFGGGEGAGRRDVFGMGDPEALAPQASIDRMEQMLDIFREYQELRLDELSGNIEMFADAVSYLSDQFAPLIGPLKDLVKSLGEAKALDIGLDALGIDSLAEALTRLTMPITTIGQMWDDMVEDFKNLKLVAGELADVLGTTQETITGFFQGILAAWTQDIPTAETEVNNFGLRIIDIFLNLRRTLIGNSIIPEMIDDIVRYFQGLPGRAAAAVRSGLGQLESIGSAIVDSIRRGIEGAWEGFKSWLQGLFDQLPQWMKDVLQMGSPARVMIPIGEGMVQGMQAGWEQAMRQFKPEVESQVGAMAAPGMGAGGGALPGITIPSPVAARMNAMGPGWAAAPGQTTVEGDRITINVRDDVAVAMAKAMISGRRRQRLDGFMGA